jgi:hypothetical protein
MKAIGEYAERETGNRESFWNWLPSVGRPEENFYNLR